MDQPIWVLINCNSSEEAKKIGDSLMERRLASCIDVLPRELTSYFWPAKSGKIETAKGALLIAETFEDRYPEIKTHVEHIHSDELPFIGYIKIEGVDEKYKEWIKGELESK